LCFDRPTPRESKNLNQSYPNYAIGYDSDNNGWYNGEGYDEGDGTGSGSDTNGNDDDDDEDDKKSR
jgi:hypothetical protein